MASSDLPPEIAEAAATWQVRRQSGDGFDAVAFQAWLEADPRHAEAWARAGSMLDSFDDYQSAPELLSLRAQVLNRAYRHGRRRWQSQVSRRGLLVAGAGLAAAIVAAPVAYFWLKPNRETYATGIGEQRTLTLADGSRVTLDANALFTAELSHGRRRIDLVHGRAHFDVAKDPKRPFSVTAHGFVVTALGTAFSVDAGRDKLVVSLFEGRVSLGAAPGSSSSRAPIEMKPLQQVVINGADPDDWRMTAFAPDREAGWRIGRLFFDHERLGDVAARMNDYSRTRITVEGPAADLPVSGVFAAGETAAFIEAVKTYYPIGAQVTPQGVTLRARS